MPLNKVTDKEFEQISENLLNNEDVLKMKEFVQHGKTSTYDHCCSVAKMALELSKRFNVSVNKEVLVKAGILHDYYLYDWHKTSLKKPINQMHGFVHPEIACQNAKDTFDVDEQVLLAIKSHMWPLNLRNVPQSKEAWLICLADKICAVRETFKK